MDINKNLPHYSTAVGLFVLLKFGFTFADTPKLNFLLYPTDRLLCAFTGSNSTHLQSGEYYHQALNIIIDKSCSGFNLWVLCFLLFTFLGLKYFDKPLHKAVILPIALILAYLITLFANTSRIIASVTIQKQTHNLFPDYQSIIHESIGVATNLTFLILAYILIEKLLTNKPSHAKLT